MSFDVNGFKGPNQYGIDIFQAYVTKEGIVPAGASTGQYHTCVKDGSNDGHGCLAKVLKNEDY